AVFVLPPIAYSVTEYATDFAGTIPLASDTTRRYVRDMCLGSVRTGFRAVIICNAHLEPTHVVALETAAEEARSSDAKVAFPDVTKKPHALLLSDEFKSGACHAGQYETSLVMTTDPFLVRDLAAELPSNPVSLSRAIKDGKKTFEQAGGPH